jgi:carbon storage regulator
MLVLTRKPNQKIMIGDNIEVRVLTVNGSSDGCVKLGFNAPKDVCIVRDNAINKFRNGGDYE